MAVDDMSLLSIEAVEPVFSSTPLENTQEVETEKPQEEVESETEPVETNEAMQSMGLGRNLNTTA